MCSIPTSSTNLTLVKLHRDRRLAKGCTREDATAQKELLCSERTGLITMSEYGKLIAG
jgi:hypothetical protein